MFSSMPPHEMLLLPMQSGASPQILDSEMEDLRAEQSRLMHTNEALYRLFDEILKRNHVLQLLNNTQQMQNESLRSQMTRVMTENSQFATSQHNQPGLSVGNGKNSTGSGSSSLQARPVWHQNSPFIQGSASTMQYKCQYDPTDSDHHDLYTCAAESESTSMSSNMDAQPTHDHSARTRGSQPAGVSARTRRSPKGAGNKDATTVFIRGIPSHYDQEMLLDHWVPDGTFDLMYMPYNVQTHTSSEYVVMNFVSRELALRFRERWHGRELDPGSGAQALEVSWARAQGLTANLVQAKRGKIDRIRNPKFQPMVFEGQHRMDFLHALAIHAP